MEKHGFSTWSTLHYGNTSYVAINKFSKGDRVKVIGGKDKIFEIDYVYNEFQEEMINTDEIVKLQEQGHKHIVYCSGGFWHVTTEYRKANEIYMLLRKD